LIGGLSLLSGYIAFSNKTWKSIVIVEIRKSK
jgi:hypothetical protein